MVRATILIINVIGVFPNIESQQRFQIALHRIASVGFLRDVQFAILVDGKPHPARTKQRGTLFRKLLLKSLERTELLLNPLGDCTRGLVVGFRSTELGEVKVVIQDLSGIVEHASVGGFHNFFQRHFLKLSAFDKTVQVVDIGLQMLAMVEAQRFLADNRLQSVCLVGQFYQFVFHNL